MPAVSARLPWMICEMRFAGTEICRDNSVGVIFGQFVGENFAGMYRGRFSSSAP
jgi:hypothetical protein